MRALVMARRRVAVAADTGRSSVTSPNALPSSPSRSAGRRFTGTIARSVVCLASTPWRSR